MGDCYWCGRSFGPDDPWVLGNQNRENDRYRGYASDNDKVPFCNRTCRSHFKDYCHGDDDADDQPDATDQAGLDDFVSEQKTLDI